MPEIVPDIDDLMSGKQPPAQLEEEETKFGMFFKKFRDRVLPPSLTHEKSNLRIYMDKNLTENLPYIIFPSHNATLIVSTYANRLLEHRDLYRVLPKVFN